MRPRRLANLSYRGREIYFLTLCSFARRECFTEEAVVDIVRLQFVKAADANDFELLAYCIMPDHLHLLVEGTKSGADLREFVSSAKRSAAYAVRPLMRGRLWQPGYYDRILRDNDDSHYFVKYILENPVRAGLAKTPSDYPFLGGSCIRNSTV